MFVFFFWLLVKPGCAQNYWSYALGSGNYIGQPPTRSMSYQLYSLSSPSILWNNRFGQMHTAYINYLNIYHIYSSVFICPKSLCFRIGVWFSSGTLDLHEWDPEVLHLVAGSHESLFYPYFPFSEIYIGTLLYWLLSLSDMHWWFLYIFSWLISFL